KAVATPKRSRAAFVLFVSRAQETSPRAISRAALACAEATASGRAPSGQRMSEDRPVESLLRRPFSVLVFRMFSERKRFRRDRDRVLGSRAFRRLSGKTQVVAIPSDPHVRTRLTHTLEVSSIAREIARPLGLVDPLVDAIALGHDLGHPAFGHAGERALAAFVPGGFHHAAHGVRVVTELEPGLDLAPEVVDGILKHSKGRSGSVFARGAALTHLHREGLVVRAADLFAYACHDLDDA